VALAAVKTFVAAEVLFAADLNTLNTNILNNALTLISPLTGTLDVDNFDITALGELAFNDAAANPTATGRLRRNGNSLVWGVVRASEPNAVFALQATTTGTPAAGIGTSILFRAESADENPSDFGEIQAVVTNAAAVEEGDIRLLLRSAGGAPVESHRFAADGTFLFSLADPATLAANTMYRGAAIKSWARINATPAIQGSYNVTSVADAGVGLVTITFDTDFANANYSITSTGGASTTTFIVGFDTFAAGTVRATITNTAGTFIDAQFMFVAIGDQ